MAKKTQSIPGFDPMAFWKDFDPAKMMGDMQAPGIDVQSIVQFQQRNLEALAAATGRLLKVRSSDGPAGEILREAMEEMRGAVESMSTKNLPEDVVVQQTDMMKQSFEKTVSNMRELSEMMAKSNTQAVDEVNRRIGESLEELKSNIKKAKG